MFLHTISLPYTHYANVLLFLSVSFLDLEFYTLYANVHSVFSFLGELLDVEFDQCKGAVVIRMHGTQPRLYVISEGSTQVLCEVGSGILTALAAGSQALLSSQRISSGKS